MNHWMYDKSPVLPLCNLRPMCDGRPPKPKGDHSVVSQKESNYFLRIDPNNNQETAADRTFNLFNPKCRVVAQPS